MSLGCMDAHYTSNVDISTPNNSMNRTSKSSQYPFCRKEFTVCEDGDFTDVCNVLYYNTQTKNYTNRCFTNINYCWNIKKNEEFF